MSLPTASSLHLAMTCPTSAALPRQNVTSEPARRGTWLHKFAQSARSDRGKALEAVPHEYREACEAIPIALLARLAHYGAELALVYDVAARTVRVIGRDIGRQYGEMAPTEIAMSIDYDGQSDDGSPHAIDLKTGRAWVPGAEHNWQVRVAALALSKLHGSDEAWGSIVHPGEESEESEGRWSHARYDFWTLADFADELQTLPARIEAARAEPMRHVAVSDHCRYCPARYSCPAQAALIRRACWESEAFANDTAMLITSLNAALAWQRVKAAKAAIGQVEQALYAFAVGNPVQLPDGRWLRELERRREVLDGPTVLAAMRELAPDIAEQAVEVRATKASIERAIKSTPGPVAPRVRQVLEAIRANGGAELRTSRSVGEATTPPGGSDATP